MSDDALRDAREDLIAEALLSEWGWEQAHGFLERMAEQRQEWAGIPMPLEDYRLQVEDRYPWKVLERVSGPQPRPEDTDTSIKLRNAWYSRRRSGWVYVFESDSGIRARFFPRWSYADRLTLWLGLMGASAAWKVEAEDAALLKLKEMVKPHLFDMYRLTGCLLETSPRSGVTYLFRKNRPTVAIAPMRRHDEDSPMHAIAVLCLHPIAFYEDTWAGSMVPTDDVIAHLTMMRGDEAYFWRCANQHDPDSPEAGI